MIRTKAEWLSTFRHVGDSILVELSKSKKSHKDKAGEINKRIKEYREQEINRINDVAKKENWDNAMAKHGLDIDFYTYRDRNVDEILPWDFIDIGVTRKFLEREWENAQNEKVTPNCRQQCSGCGAARFGGGVCFENKN